MILLRKGGELAAFHYSWIWCLLLHQKGQSILLVTLSLSCDLSVFGFGTFIIKYSCIHFNHYFKKIFISFRSFVYCIRMYICRRFIGMHTQYLRNAPGERRKDGLHILVSHRTDWYHTESAAGAWNHPVHHPEIQTAALVSR